MSKFGNLVCVLALCVSYVGCNQTKTEEPSAAADGEKATESRKAVAQTPETGSAKRGLKVRPNVSTFPGRWGLVILQPVPDQSGNPSYRDLCLSLLEFSEAEGTISGKALATLPQAPPVEISDVVVNGNAIEFKFLWNEATGDYEGTLADGVVRGSLNVPDMGVIAAMLRPTDEASYEGWDPMPQAQGRVLFNEAAAAKDQPKAVLAVARELRGSPLSLQAYDAVLARMRQYPDLPETQVREIVADMQASAAPWGERIKAQALFKAAMGVTMTRRYPSLALELIDQAKEKLGTGEEEYAEPLKYASEQALADLSLSKIRSNDPAAQQEAHENLKALLTKQRYNPEILEALGTYALKHDDPQGAKEHFADIVALPMLEQMLQASRPDQPPGDPSPREQLLKLWEAEHDSIEGFEEFLHATYQRRMAELSEETRTAGPAPLPADQRKRVSLVELFTGTGCPPCVAGDAAVDVLHDVYPQHVIALQYHQHIPAPDPLTNQDSEDRLTYYSIGGTPAVFVDGLTHPPQMGIGGFLQSVGTSYSLLRSMVDTRIPLDAVGELQLAASVENGDLSISATGTGFEESLLPKLRMRLALAEDVIDFVAPNGVRQHHLVVREMPGGAKGTSAREGKFAYTLQMPLSDVEQHLTDYLSQFEAGRNITFPLKPTALGPLSLVAWVQNDETREILHAAIVPVSGTGGPASATPGKPAGESPAATESPASALQPSNTP